MERATALFFFCREQITVDGHHYFCRTTFSATTSLPKWVAGDNLCHQKEGSSSSVGGLSSIQKTNMLTCWKWRMVLDFVPVIPNNTESEKYWTQRALACPQLRSETINITTPQYLYSAGMWAHKGSPSTPCTDWVRYHQQESTKLADLNAVRKSGNASLILDFDSPKLAENAIQEAETVLEKSENPLYWENYKLSVKPE